MRIARALALAGIDSRRKCEAHIEDGFVTVNGKVVTNLATQVDIENDFLAFKGKGLFFESNVYYLLHKPKGYTTTAKDRHAKKTVFELLPSKLVSRLSKGSDRIRVFPIGRLDRESTGVLLFTNDGALANRLTHPRYGVEKVYEVRLDRAFESKDKIKLLKGVRLREGMARIKKMRPVSRRVLQVTLQEGKKREVRRIFEAIGYEVVKLCRISFGPLHLGRLNPGEGRFLGAKEVQKLNLSSQSPN